MNQYMIIYLGGDHPSSPEERQQHMASYQQWLTTLGSAAIKPMVPLKHSHTITPDGSISPNSSINMSGYTLIQAESIEQALELAKSCPFLAINGTIEVTELVPMQ